MKESKFNRPQSVKELSVGVHPEHWAVLLSICRFPFSMPGASFALLGKKTLEVA